MIFAKQSKKFKMFDKIVVLINLLELEEFILDL